MTEAEAAWRHRNVFVTGATGFLGSWLTEALVARGANVVALVRDHVPDSRFVLENVGERVVQVKGRIEDYLLLHRVLCEYEIDTVFHLAAQTQVKVANGGPLSTFDANIRGTWNLLEAARHCSTLERVVVASSDKAYGAKSSLPYAEDDPLVGRHPYDVSKSCADLISQTYSATFQVPVCIARCGNFFGGGDLNFARLVPGTIRSVLFDEPVIIRSDGTLLRDYFFIADGVGAYLCLAERMGDLNIAGEAFNFSPEQPATVTELVSAILQAMGSPDHEVQILEEASNEIPQQALSVKKARDVLGWDAEHSLEEGMLQTVAWYRQFFEKHESWSARS